MSTFPCRLLEACSLNHSSHGKRKHSSYTPPFCKTNVNMAKFTVCRRITLCSANRREAWRSLFITTGEQVCTRVPICKHMDKSVLNAANRKGQMRWLQQSGTSSRWNHWRKQCFLLAKKSAACFSHQLTRQKLGVSLTPGYSSSIVSIVATGMVLVLPNSFRSISCAQRRKQNSSVVAWTT